MVSRLAVKRLTNSDLTFLRPWFTRYSTSKQKAINLNRDIFVDEIYPGLVDSAGSYPIELHLYGPGFADMHSLARKIVRDISGKNWRLNGELVNNPDEEPARFDPLFPGDLALLEFSEGNAPAIVRLAFIARNVPADIALHTRLDALFPSSTTSMIALDAHVVGEIADAVSLDPAHPVHLFAGRPLVTDPAVEEIALGGSTPSIPSRRPRRRLTRLQLQQARLQIEDIGARGEALLDAYFADQLEQGLLDAYEWVAAQDALSPYDYTISPAGHRQILLDVKSTPGEFSRPVHISIAQLRDMADDSREYHLYRIYNLTDAGGFLRICTDTRTMARMILATLAGLPEGVVLDSVSVSPDALPFGERILLSEKLEGED